RRARLVPAEPPARAIVVAGPRSDPRDSTPFAIVSEVRRTGRAGQRLMRAMSRHLEEQARRAGGGAVLLSSFGHGGLLDTATRERFAGLAAVVGFCGVVGEQMAAEPAPGVRGGALHPADPLAREWATAVVSPQLAATLCAYDHGGDDYEFVLTHDRELAVGAAASLMARIAS
ncbi:MAG: hypothetical protein M3P44_12945, partial [Actinomycetota bacterium]|nr:hypothetical protein [Actinomycetota bacterium]